jgi:hypothetical protein
MEELIKSLGLKSKFKFKLGSKASTKGFQRNFKNLNNNIPWN